MSEAALDHAAGSRHKARCFALQALYQHQLNGLAVGELLSQFLAEKEMDRADREYFSELVRGAMEKEGELVTAFARYLDRPLTQLDPVERAVLLIGSFELLHRPELPYRVAINEAVQLAKTYGASESHKYVNGIMDRLAKTARKVELSIPGDARP